MSRKKISANRRASQRLAFHKPRTVDGSWVVPLRWLKNFVAVFLLPIAFLLTQTFFGLFAKVKSDRAFLTGDEFWFFCLGGVLWTLWFFGSIWSLGGPRPIRAYVFGHELTHAIWVWLWGGRVSRMEVTRDGGYILTDTHNFWIALAPYFYPIYSIFVILGFGIASLFCDFTKVEETLLFMTPLQWLFLLLGATWAFHMSFTIWMIPKGQSDLTSHGTFFSLVIIYLMNLLLLTGFLLVIDRELSFAGYFQELFENTRRLAVHIVRWVDQWRGAN